MTDIELNAEYDFEIKESTIPKYQMCASISQWIYSNLENLLDDDHHKLFNKINYGYNEDTLKSFGKKPVADIYMDTVDYDEDFTSDYPEAVNSIIIFHVKGTSDKAYLKACEIHDYIMQQFIENVDWRELESIVKDTHITNSQLMNHPRNGWAVMGAFELRHDLY